jgi:hypothetical protein
MKKKKWLIGILALCLVLIGVTICVLLKKEKEQTNPQVEWEYVSEDEGDSMNIYDWVEETEKMEEGFPYDIEGTELTICAIKPYNGIFLENGSDEPIENVSTMLLQNQSDQYIEYAKITCLYGETEYVYEAKTLEPNSMMMVQESNGASYIEGVFDSCTAMAANMDGLEMSTGDVRVETNALGKIRITNISEKDIPCVRIFYKFYLDDIPMFIGGITYTAKLTELKKGEERIISPSHFSNGLSRIMMVRTYDTTE